MELRLKRIALRSEYTIGKLYVDGEYVCDTIEDTVRDLDKDGKFSNGEVKIPGKTAIPYGRYEVTMKVQQFHQVFLGEEVRWLLATIIECASFRWSADTCRELRAGLRSVRTRGRK